jgi:hypothetical protein
MKTTGGFAQEKVVARSVGGETVLVPIQDRALACEHVYLLNKVAAFLWSQLDGERGVAELSELVSGRFDVDAGQDVDADVRRFLDELERRGLARPRDVAKRQPPAADAAATSDAAK